VGDAVQRIERWAYATTHLRPASAMAAVVRSLSVRKRAALWNNAADAFMREGSRGRDIQGEDQGQ
jgi:hypothetical protein